MSNVRKKKASVMRLFLVFVVACLNIHPRSRDNPRRLDSPAKFLQLNHRNPLRLQLPEGFQLPPEVPRYGWHNRSTRLWLLAKGHHSDRMLVLMSNTSVKQFCCFAKIIFYAR